MQRLQTKEWKEEKGNAHRKEGEKKGRRRRGKD